MRLRNVALEIHALMEDADDIDTIGGEPVKQEMRSAGNFVVAGAYVRACLTNRWTRCHFPYALPDFAGIRLRLQRSAV